MKFLAPQYKTDLNKLEWVQKTTKKAGSWSTFSVRSGFFSLERRNFWGENNSSLPVSTLRLSKRWSQALHSRKMRNNRHNEKQESFRPDICCNSFREQWNHGAAFPEKPCSLHYWKFPRHYWLKPWATWSDILEQQVRLENKSLPTSLFL